MRKLTIPIAIVSLVIAVASAVWLIPKRTSKPAFTPSPGVVRMLSRLEQRAGWIVGYSAKYLRVLDRIENLPEPLRAEIARDPANFFARSEKLIRRID
jgi:hypothetical protein